MATQLRNLTSAPDGAADPVPIRPQPPASSAGSPAVVPSSRELVAELARAGAARRAGSPRSEHGRWAPPADRPDPIDLLAADDRGRLPELLPVRYGRMLTSPFAFLRGSMAVMAADLATTPASGLRVQAVGDAHLLNFGVFATPERNFIFDVNDFDETIPGPWEWDLKRLAVSVVVAGRTHGISEQRCADAVAAAARRYRKRLAKLAGMPIMDAWYARMDVDQLDRLCREPGPRRQLLRRHVHKWEQRTSATALPKLTTVVDGGYVIDEDPPLLIRVPDGWSQWRLRRLLRSYRSSLPAHRRLLLRRYRYADAARKVVGVGSVGTRCYVVLLFGAGAQDPLLLQIKQARPSVLAPYVGAAPHRHQGKRVVVGQELLQAASDLFLGWGHVGGTDFHVRQLRDLKGSFDLATFRAKDLVAYAELCARALAHAHARSGEAAAISGYLGGSRKFDRSVVAFARAYADQVEQDHAALLAAVKAGRIPAETGI